MYKTGMFEHRHEKKRNNKTSHEKNPAIILPHSWTDKVLLSNGWNVFLKLRLRIDVSYLRLKKLQF